MKTLLLSGGNASRAIANFSADMMREERGRELPRNCPLEGKNLRRPGEGNNAAFPVSGVSGLLSQITRNGARTWLLRIMVGNKRGKPGAMRKAPASPRLAKSRLWSALPGAVSIS